jgi:hypothetical protein
MTDWPLLPILARTMHEDQLDCLILEGIMKRDFGPWKKDEFRSLTFDFVRGTVMEYDDNGEVLKSVRLKLEAV